jgi:ATP-dependent Lhr-like helicase
VLRRVRRASVAALRQEAEAVDPAELARFLPAWQNVDVHRPAGAGLDRLREALVPLQGVALTPEVWERDVLPRRLGAYNASWLDPLTTSGEIVWIGAGPLGRSGKVALYYREDVRLAGPPPANAKLELPEGDVHSAIRERLALAPSFWLDLVAELDSEREELHTALWDLVWAGEVTNDAFAPLRARRLTAVGRDRRPARRFASRRSPAQEAIVGRWSLTETLFANAPAQGPRTRAQAELMLERYGIVTRETVLAEGIPGGFSSLYGELSNLEMLGTARRGYFVEGLGGAQFALAGAVERLRGLPHREGEYMILAATDPAQPYGAALAWPKRAEGRRPARTAGAYVLLRDGNPVIYVERGGKGIVRLVELEGEELTAAISELASAAQEKLIPKLGIERVDGEPVMGSGLEEEIIAAGFSRQPRKLVAAG